MGRIELSKATTASPETVWSVITDLDAAPERISGIEKIERLAGPGGFGVGTRWRETRTMFGKQATEEMEVAAIEEGRSYTVVADSHSTEYVSTLGVAPDGSGGTVISMSFEGRPQGPFAKVLGATAGRLFAGATRRALAKDLEESAAAAEVLDAS